VKAKRLKQKGLGEVKADRRKAKGCEEGGNSCRASFASQIHDADDACDARDASPIDNQLITGVNDAT